jgi:hypothetical protein
MGDPDMADKLQPQGFSKAKAAEGEGFSARRATEEDDVEGHRFISARDGFSKAKASPDDFSKAKGSPDGFSKAKAAGEDDDVEGHSMMINPLAARELNRARERDVQANIKRHNFESDARAAKKDRG